MYDYDGAGRLQHDGLLRVSIHAATGRCGRRRWRVPRCTESAVNGINPVSPHVQAVTSGGPIYKSHHGGGPLRELMSALILAGGKATRLGGIAKHEIVVERETIFARQVKVLAPRVTEILVSGAVVDGYRTVRDLVEDAGPLAGIAAGLAACRTEWLLILAGDMPFITGELVDRLIARAITSQDPRGNDCAEGVGIRINGLPEPLVCILHKRVLPAIERRLSAGDYKVSRLLTDELWVTWIDDADPKALRNLNSPEDLAGITGSK